MPRRSLSRPSNAGTAEAEEEDYFSCAESTNSKNSESNNSNNRFSRRNYNESAFSLGVETNCKEPNWVSVARMIGQHNERNDNSLTTFNENEYETHSSSKLRSFSADDRLQRDKRISVDVKAITTTFASNATLPLPSVQKNLSRRSRTSIDTTAPALSLYDALRIAAKVENTTSKIDLKTSESRIPSRRKNSFMPSVPCGAEPSFNATPDVNANSNIATLENALLTARNIIIDDSETNLSLPPNKKISSTLSSRRNIHRESNSNNNCSNKKKHATALEYSSIANKLDDVSENANKTNLNLAATKLLSSMTSATPENIQMSPHVVISRSNSIDADNNTDNVKVETRKTAMPHPKKKTSTNINNHNRVNFKEKSSSATHTHQNPVNGLRKTPSTIRMCRKELNNLCNQKRRMTKSIKSMVPATSLNEKTHSKNIVTTNDFWDNEHLQRLINATQSVSLSTTNYWDTVATIVSPEGQVTAHQCAARLMLIEEAKLCIANKKNAHKKQLPTKDEVKARIPAKGNTRAWRMNQYIQLMSVSDNANNNNNNNNSDLLKHQFESDKIETEATTPIITSFNESIKQTDNSASNALEKLETTESRSRTSIPLWMMTPGQFQMLGELHTGLTPRDEHDDKENLRFKSSSTHVETPVQKNSKTQHHGIEKDDDDDDDDDHDNVSDAAADILGAVPERSLEMHWLIERHRKKAVEATHNKNHTSVLSKEKKKQMFLSSTNDLFDSSNGEINRVLNRHETVSKVLQRQEIQQDILWEVNESNILCDREQALEELCVFSDDEQDSLKIGTTMLEIEDEKMF